MRLFLVGLAIFLLLTSPAVDPGVKVLLVGVPFGLYLLSFFWPNRRCPRCGGSGNSYAPFPFNLLFGAIKRACPRCYGDGGIHRGDARALGVQDSFDVQSARKKQRTGTRSTQTRQVWGRKPGR